MLCSKPGPAGLGLPGIGQGGGGRSPLSPRSLGPFCAPSAAPGRAESRRIPGEGGRRQRSSFSSPPRPAAASWSGAGSQPRMGSPRVQSLQVGSPRVQSLKMESPRCWHITTTTCGTSSWRSPARRTTTATSDLQVTGQVLKGQDQPGCWGHQTWAAELSCFQQTPGHCLLPKAPNVRAPRANPRVDSERFFPSETALQGLCDINFLLSLFLVSFHTVGSCGRFVSLVSTVQGMEWNWFRTLSVPPVCADCTSASF